VKTAAVFLALIVLAKAAELPPAGLRAVEPIFREHCHAGHGAEKQKSDYRLDVRERLGRRFGNRRSCAVKRHTPSGVGDSSRSGPYPGRELEVTASPRGGVESNEKNLTDHNESEHDSATTD